jgi:serine/threonine-protein kinase
VAELTLEEGDDDEDASAVESQIRSSRVALNLGDILDGKYRVERLVGQGGMGQVFAATHVALGQQVAIKIMLAEKAENEDSVERFLHEARAAVMLKSSHVARVYDVGTTRGSPYIVMEFLDGKDLVTMLLESGRFAHVEAVDCLLQACDAVAEAHALGIIHRDLKPENLFLSRTRDGSPQIKVIDFGISKIGGADSAARKVRRVVTQEHTVLGSPSYMSPEQVKSSKRVDERSDIWSLGVTLYELLTAAEPFGADTTPEIFVNVLTVSPMSPAQVVPEVPPDLSAVVMRCLEKEPADRFQSVAELASALVPFSSNADRGSRPSWTGDMEPASSRSLVRRLETPRELPVQAPVQQRTVEIEPPAQPRPLSVSTPRQPVSGHLPIADRQSSGYLVPPPAPPSSGASLASPSSLSSMVGLPVSATISEDPPPRSRVGRAVAIVATVAVLAVVAFMVVGGVGWSRAERSEQKPAAAAAAPNVDTSLSAPPPTASAAPEVAASATATASASPSSPSSAKASAPAAPPRGGRAASPRPVARPAVPNGPPPKPSALPRERTSW